jgi:transposase
MSSIAIVHLGVDVCKATLQFDGPCRRSTLVTSNHPRAITGLLRSLHALYPQLHVVCEASGGYERLLVAAAQMLGIAFTIVDPWRVRHFGYGLGILEKTDPIDAALLRRYAQAVQPPPTTVHDQALQQLRQWVQLRDHYVAQLAEEQTFLQSLPAQQQQSLVRAQCRRLERLIEKLDGQIEQWLTAQAPALRDAVQTMCLVSGVAWRCASGLLAYLPELGRCGGQQIAKLAGVAPIADDSGPRHGPRHIQRGRPNARRVLYMAALAAARFNDHLRPFYLRLRAAGKPPKVALIAVARKLLVFLNSILKPAYSSA